MILLQIEFAYNMFSSQSTGHNPLCNSLYEQNPFTAQELVAILPAMIPNTNAEATIKEIQILYDQVKKEITK